MHLTNSHLQLSDLESYETTNLTKQQFLRILRNNKSYETTNLETQNYAESACENRGEIVKQLIGSEKKPKYQISWK